MTFFIRLSGAQSRARLASRRSVSPGAFKRAAFAFVIAVFLLGSGVAPAKAESAQERSVKAAFLLKFVGYVEFPEGSPAASAGPLVIGVLGADEIGAELVRTMAGRTINNRPVTVKILRPSDSIAGVHVLFIGGGSERSQRLLHAATNMGVLTVTESDGGLREGSVINFRLVDERVRFEVSLDAAEKARLKLSSRLLSVAYFVQKELP
jgi:hypothetical protein